MDIIKNNTNINRIDELEKIVKELKDKIKDLENKIKYQNTIIKINKL